MSQPIVKNAVRCGICQAPADRYSNLFQCQANPNHVGDLIVGIFSDLTYPERGIRDAENESIKQITDTERKEQ